jgi:exportin-T
MFYLYHRFIKDLRTEIPVDICSNIIDSMRDLLPIVAEIPEPEEPETDILTEAIQGSAFDSQLYLFETVGTLCSLVYKSPAQQATLLLSLVKPLMDDLSNNFQAFRANGPSDLVPIVKVHHIIMALGNISKGFPDYPSVVPENYILPPLEVFGEMAQAILVILEAMNVFKPIRDAVSCYRFYQSSISNQYARPVSLLLGYWRLLGPQLRILFRL